MSKIKDLVVMDSEVIPPINEYIGDRMRALSVSEPKVLVYGTLKKGFPNHKFYLDKADFLGDCDRLHGIMFHLGGYPAINLIEPRSPIIGEVYKVSPITLQGLDRLEGIPHHYHRILQFVPGFGYLYTYVYPRERCNDLVAAIPDGVWRGPETTKVLWKGWGLGFEEIGPPAPSGALRRGELAKPPNAALEAAKVPAEARRPPRCHFVPAGEPGWVMLVRDDTGETTGPFKVVGQQLMPDGSIKPKITWNGRTVKDGPIAAAIKEAVKEKEDKPLILLPTKVTGITEIKTKEPDSRAGPGIQAAV